MFDKTKQYWNEARESGEYPDSLTVMAVKKVTAVVVVKAFESMLSVEAEIDEDVKDIARQLNQ